MTSRRKTKALVTRKKRDELSIPSRQEVDILAQGLFAKLNADLQEQFEDDAITVLELLSSPIKEIRPPAHVAESQLIMALQQADEKAQRAQDLRDEIQSAYNQPKRRAFLGG